MTRTITNLKYLITKFTRIFYTINNTNFINNQSNTQIHGK